MNKRLPRLRSLKSRILATVLTMLLVSIGLLTLGIGRMLRSDMEQALGGQQVATVTLVAAQLSANFKERADALQLIASKFDPSLLERPDSVEARLLNRPVLQVLFNAGVLVTRADGTAVAEVPSLGRIGLNYLDRDHMAAALREGRATVGKPVMGKTVKAPGFGMTAPIRNAQGVVIGALTGATDLSKPNFLDSLISSTYGTSGGYLVVDPRHRIFVTATADNTRLAMQALPALGVNPVLDRRVLGFDGSAVHVGSQGIEVITASGRIAVADWLVISTLPTHEAFAPIRSLERHLAMLALVLSLMSLGFTWWMLQRLLAPMQRAAVAVPLIASEGAAQAPLPITTHDEIGQLIEGFNQVLAVSKQREDALSASEARFRAFFELNLAIMLLIRPGDGRILDANPAALGYYGYDHAALCGLHIHELNVLPPEDCFSEMADASNQRRNHFSSRHRKADGVARDVEVYPTPIRIDGSVALFTIVHDVTERTRIELDLKIMNKDFVTLLDNSSDFLYFKDRDSRFRYCSQTMADITGHKSWRDMVGKHDLEVFPPETAEIYFKEEASIFAEGRPLLNKIDPFVMADGSTGWVSTNKWPMFADDGHTVVGLFGISRDVTEAKRLEDELLVMATTDFLTGVDSRRTFVGAVDREIARMQRDSSYVCAIMMFDLDRFKLVNDTHGHAAGDEVLKHVIQLLTSEIRKVDRIGRMGGEEFALLMPGADLSAAQGFAERLRQKIEAAPVWLGEQRIGVTVSIGLSSLRASDECCSPALARVDQALYEAKHQGRNRVAALL